MALKRFLAVCNKQAAVLLRALSIRIFRLFLFVTNGGFYEVSCNSVRSERRMQPMRCAQID
jgi:hypothetical protein